MASTKHLSRCDASFSTFDNMLLRRIKYLMRYECLATQKQSSSHTYWRAESTPSLRFASTPLLRYLQKG